MATTAAIFSFLRRRSSPSPEAFLAPADHTRVALGETLAAISAELISSYSHNSFPFQRNNSRSLVRKIEVLVALVELLKTSTPQPLLPSAARLCFQELYLILYRSKMLLDYCTHSSRLWLLLQNHPVSGHFHDLTREISTLLDVFPLKELDFAGDENDDVREQVELLQRQSRRAKLEVDEGDEALRLQGFAFLNSLEKGQVPNPTELRSFFVEGLGVRDARDLRTEIEFLEEEIRKRDGGDLEPPASVLYGLIALARYYSTFLLFRFDETTQFDQGHGRCSEQEQSCRETKNVRGIITKEIADTFVTIPGDFVCPISLDLMRDPVIVCTGQTYDRSSISRWFDQGGCTCPKTGQLLVHTNVVANRALRNLIHQWSIAHAAITVFDPSESPVVASPPSPPYQSPSDAFAAAAAANRATIALLIEELASGSHSVRAAAAREIRLLAKTGKGHRAHIAEAGAIPHLKSLLWSRDAAAQENAVTALLNLSIHDGNRRLIMEEEGCLESIVEVLRSGIAAAAMENAAAALFSLSAVHDYKRRIVDQEGAVEALAGMVKWGTLRGKKDAVGALFNLSTHPANCARMVDAGALKAVVGALATEEVAEVAARALTLIVRQPAGAEAVGDEEATAGAVVGLIGMMRSGTPRGKENAVAALLELCRSGGAAATERVVTTTPALEGLLQSLLFTGTKRARRKVASLARLFQRCENAAAAATATALHFGGLGVRYSFAANSVAGNRDPNLGVDVSVPPMPISVPVL